MKSKVEDVDIGYKFGKLTICEYIGNHIDINGKFSENCFLCKCDCGNTIYMDIKNIVSGKRKSCGCLVGRGKSKILKRRETLNKTARIHIGEVFGRLEIAEIEYNGRRNICICKCQCGNITKVPYYELKNGKVRSCGCLHSEIISKNALLYKKDTPVRRWYFIKDGNIINCRSGFEVLYANYLIDNDIPFLYEPTTLECKNKSHYTPDFYLPNENKFIEIKGTFYIHSKQEEKIKELSDTYNISIIKWEDIKSLTKIKYSTYNDLLRNAYRNNIPPEDYLGNKMYYDKIIK